ncbi:fibril protein [Myxococcaceae bacterium JPH2]|nr:fibril protein [Myxococcaceae bacterium JPH2]
MSPHRITCLALLLLGACASAPPPRAPVRDVPFTYGRQPEDPVHVGHGSAGVMAYFEQLRGPRGQRVAWRRVGSCCAFRLTGKLAPRHGRLVVFEVTYEGLDEPVLLYVDPFQARATQAPRGFQFAPQAPPRPAGISL